MTVSVFDMKRAFALIGALLLAASGLAMAPAVAADGVPPEIVSIVDTDLDIDPDEKRALEVITTGVDAGATFTFSGEGVEVTTYREKAGGLFRMHVTAEADAAGGFRDLTVTNPDGLSDTWPDAMFVTGDTEPPEVGDLTVHVFEDLDGNGIEDGADSGLAGVAVDVDDVDGGNHNIVTDGSGDATLVGLPVGDATVTYATPAAMALTTGNGVQVVTVVVDVSTAADSVGYATVPTGDVGGHVFEDLDGNGIEDGADAGLAGVAVTVTDSGGGDHNVVTDSSGDYSVTQLPLGDADVVYTTPAGYTLTTANDVQVATVTDGGSATATTVGYEPPSGDGPQIIGVIGDDEIDPGDSKHFIVEVLNFEAGGTASLSGIGTTVKIKVNDDTSAKLSVKADSDAVGGPRDLTITNPGGGSDTLVGAITVTGDIPPPISGDVSGHVFQDLDANGIEDGGDTGLVGVDVSFLDEAGDTWAGVTDINGDFTVAVGVGDGTLTVAGSAGATLTTGNNIQDLTITEGLETVADPVGYLPPSGDTTFVNVALAGGINTDHDANGLCTGMPTGIGSAWADADGDGDQDLFTTSRGGANHFYRNDGDVNSDGVTDFTDVAVALGLDAPTEDSFSTVFVDYDNDGDQDLFVANSSGNTLWENQVVGGGGLSFIDVSATADLDDIGRVQTATWGDVDDDGFLDVYFAKHGSCAVGGTTTDRLFHNNGDGTFSDWTTYLCSGGAIPCDDVAGLGFAAGMFDYDNDGDTDIYVVNDNIAGGNQPNKLFRNDGSDGSGGWLFVEDSATANLGYSINGMGLAIGDYNNDGFLDLAFSDAGPGFLVENDGDGTFTNVSGSSGVSAALSGGVSWGTAFLDYNNDGSQDLFFAQGSIGTPAALASAMLENDGFGNFTDVTDITGMGDEARARNVSTGDFNADGWIDVYVGNYDDYPLLMENKAEDNGNLNEWLTITVEGTDSNRDGIGTIIEVTTAGGTQTQLISSGGNHGGGSQKAAFFGLGADTSATVTIMWPNGEVSNIGSVGSAQAVHYVEPAI